jgi:3-deoxy-D-manno-octulosonic-acid transferase
MKIGSFFNEKLKRGIAGRRQNNENLRQKITKKDKVIWMHAASLGEYEQGLPVLEKLKEKFPEHKILITFFSPSGYENVVKKATVADVVCYLPFDLKKQVREFISQFQTDIFFTVKYDFWIHLLEELKKQNAKVYVISALFYEKQIFFKPYGKWLVGQLKKNVDWFFHQTKHSADLAKNIGLMHSSVSGDTRFDRVKQILQRDNFVEFIQEFKENQKLIVFGSSWEAEEKIAKIVSKSAGETKIIIAPHDLKRIDNLKQIFPDALLYSQFTFDFQRTSHILIIDSIGLLSKIYSYADIAVVGGGFHQKGLHNILEPATFGIPVFFGNFYKKNPEADELIQKNGGKSFATESDLAQFITELLNENSENKLKEMGKNAGHFIASQPDATENILRKILD